MRRARIRAVAILIRGDKILLIHRTKNGKEFWVFPGGGVEDDEKIEDAVVREVEEEGGIKCGIVKLLYTHVYPDVGHKQFFYLCKYISGEPKLGEYNEFQTMKKENQTYEPTWVKIKDLPKKLLYPLEIRDWIMQDYMEEFKDNTPMVASIKSTDLRREI